ncbi:hypothetical protein AQUCO_02400155v1 [Aquilegia coerulea]|nr:hypothetical protein AQUCO_02400155v1 [Aquilegia coerulea]
MKRKRKKSNIEEENSSPSHNLFHANVHIILLASLANLHTNFSARTLLTKCLNILHNQSLNPSKTLTLINNNLFLSLLPSLLRTTKSIPSIAKLTAEIIGVISLQSFECNEKIASDEEVLKALLDALVSLNKKVSMAACNAVLDLSTTSVAREKLCALNAVVKLMSIFLQNAAFPTQNGFLCSNGKISAKFSGGSFMENAFLVLIIDATVALINTCNVNQLSEIPEKLCDIILSYLKILLVQVRDQSSERHIAKCSKERKDCLSVIKFDDLTESIFRLSIDSGNFTATCGAEQVKRSIFGPNQSDFEHFMFSFWEKSPFLLRKKPLGSPNGHCDILSSLLRPPDSGRINDVLSSILGSLVSCPPLPSDEVDILNFLKEAKDGLGQRITYGQDIRVVKAVEGNGTDQGYPKSEVHFQQKWTGSCRSGLDLINIDDVQKCEEAYQNGYTIALRGMEFRSYNIASVANGLAVLFGQPSVGANSYLTPPGSQGLARHYDDHCVFVCQLLGQKQWTVYPRSTLHLPRLYEPRDGYVGSEGEVPYTKCEQFLLGEGDILYIPRGCLHEACTRADDGGSDIHGASTGFSLHLTLGIEVESPFE